MEEEKKMEGKKGKQIKRRRLNGRREKAGREQKMKNKENGIRRKIQEVEKRKGGTETKM